MNGYGPIGGGGADYEVENFDKEISDAFSETNFHFPSFHCSTYVPAVSEHTKILTCYVC